jgi:hypothetical protein
MYRELLMESSALESAESWVSFFWWFKLAAAALVTIGVGMEFGSDWLSRPFEKAIEDARKLELSKLNNEISAADARAKEAELQLQKLASPREIYLEAFRKEIEDKPKSHVQIWYLESEDARWYVNRLYAALSISNWYVETPVPIPPLPDDVDPRLREMMLSLNTSKATLAGGQPFGTTVIGTDDGPIKALIDALRKTSTEQLLFDTSGSQFMPVPAGTVRIVVGEKGGLIVAPAGSTPAK